MTRAVISWLLTIDGCPYAAATLGCPTSVSSSDTDYPTGAVVLPGSIGRDALARLGWNETVVPTDGTLSVSSITVALDDVVATSGPANGAKAWSQMFSKRVRAMDAGPLASSISASDTSIVIAFDPGFSTGPQTIWIDREAIRCSSFNAGTKTFTVTTRGYLGTRAAAHTIDAANAFTPVVRGEYPNPQRRRAILWMVEGGIASPVWRGYVGRAPRLASDGVRWELQIDHAWTVQSNRALGPTVTTARLVGYQPESFSVALWQMGFAGETVNRWDAIAEPAPTWLESLDEAMTAVVDSINAQILATSVSVTGSVRYTISDGRPRVDSSLNGFHTLVGTARGAQPGSSVERFPEAQPSSSATEASTGVWTAQWSWPYRIRGAHFLANPRGSNTFTIDNATAIPTSGLVTSTTDGANVTSVQWCLVGSDEYGFAFYVGLTGVDAATRRVSGVFRRRALVGDDTIATAEIVSFSSLLFTNATPVTIATRVESSHWIYAVRRGVLSLSYGLDDQADPRDWTWDSAPRVVGSTGGEYATARVWVFDGTTKLGEFAKDACRLDAVAIGLRGSRLSFEAFDPPLDSDDADYSLDLTAGAGIHQAQTGYTTQPESIINSVTITSEKRPSVTVNNQTSIALYGLGAPLEIEAKGAVAQVVGNKSPFELARGPLSRAIGMWSEPVERIEFDAPFTSLTSAELCGIASLTSRTIPDGTGVVALVTKRGRIVSRAVDFQRGVVRIGMLCFPQRVSGYAACARVDGFGAPSNRKVSLATAYMPESATATDYAGSNLPDYVGTANDGGASRWRVGDVVRFRIFDDASGVEEGGWTITDVDPAGASITIDADPSGGATDWVALLAGGSTIEVVSDDYDATPAISSTQAQYAYIGSRTARTLDGDELKEWAP